MTASAADPLKSTLYLGLLAAEGRKEAANGQQDVFSPEEGVVFNNTSPASTMPRTAMFL